MYQLDNDLKLRERASTAFPSGVYDHQASWSVSPSHPPLSFHPSSTTELPRYSRLFSGLWPGHCYKANLGNDNKQGAAGHKKWVEIPRLTHCEFALGYLQPTQKILVHSNYRSQEANTECHVFGYPMARRR